MEKNNDLIRRLFDFAGSTTRLLKRVPYSVEMKGITYQLF